VKAANVAIEGLYFVALKEYIFPDLIILLDVHDAGQHGWL